MKIKLVTFAPHPNFGTCLQSYALNKVLRDKRHEVEFIYNCRENPPLTLNSFIIHCIKKVVRLILSDSQIELIRNRSSKKTNQDTSIYILKLPNHNILYLLSKLPFYSKWYKRHKCINLQWKKVYKFTYEDGNFDMQRIFTYKQYDEITKNTDLFITGSDQIWNPYCGGYNPMMFLEFAGNAKRVAYSSSISQPEIPIEIKERMKDALNKFTHIGVREQRSVELLNQLLNRNDVKLVVDPTYLLSSTEWEEFGNRAMLEFTPPEKYIFCYFVGNKRKKIYDEMVQEVKKYTGISDVITLECYNRKYAYGNGRLYKDAGPYEWVYLLRHASYICMDSFHATIFALKFQKEFVHVMKNEEDEVGSQNTRMHDILNRYDLSYKVYMNSSNAAWQQPINYEKVTPIINAEIEDSMSFLEYELNQ